MKLYFLKHLQAMEGTNQFLAVAVPLSVVDLLPEMELVMWLLGDLLALVELETVGVRLAVALGVVVPLDVALLELLTLALSKRVRLFELLAVLEPLRATLAVALSVAGRLTEVLSEPLTRALSERERLAELEPARTLCVALAVALVVPLRLALAELEAESTLAATLGDSVALGVLLGDAETLAEAATLAVMLGDAATLAVPTADAVTLGEVATDAVMLVEGEEVRSAMHGTLPTSAMLGKKPTFCQLRQGE